MFEKINDVIKELKKKLMFKYKKKYHKSRYCFEEINQSNMLNRKKDKCNNVESIFVLFK